MSSKSAIVCGPTNVPGLRSSHGNNVSPGLHLCGVGTGGDVRNSGCGDQSNLMHEPPVTSPLGNIVVAMNVSPSPHLTGGGIGVNLTSENGMLTVPSFGAFRAI